MNIEGNSPSCPYCKGEDVPGCYCVVRMTHMLPQPHDEHVKLYDAWYVSQRYREAKRAGNIALQYAIKAGMNAYMLPFAEMRRALQRCTFKAST